MIRIAIVEDEPKLSSLLDDYMRAEGFDTDVFDNGTIALEHLEKSPADFVLLDLMLPTIFASRLARVRLLPGLKRFYAEARLNLNRLLTTQVSSSMRVLLWCALMVRNAL